MKQTKDQDSGDQGQSTPSVRFQGAKKSNDGEEEKKDNKSKATTNKIGIVGETEELSANVHVAGTEQQHHHTKITEAIADCVGEECDMP